MNTETAVYEQQLAMDDRRKEFGYRVGEVARLWRGHIARSLKPVGLSFMQWSTLTQLSRAGCGLMQKELAHRVSIETPTMVGVLDRLVKGDFVERRVSETDRRANTVHLTDKGRAILVEAETQLKVARSGLLEGFSETDLQTGKALLERLVERARAL